MKKLLGNGFMMLFLVGMASMSCIQEDNPQDVSDSDLVGMSVSIGIGLEDETKSSIVSDSESYVFERTIKNVTLFQFYDGKLCHSYYAESADGTISLTVQGSKGSTYDFYGLANCGDLSNSLLDGDPVEMLHEMDVNYSDPVNDLKSMGIPMYCAGPAEGDVHKGVPVTFSEGGAVSTLLFSGLLRDMILF